LIRTGPADASIDTVVSTFTLCTIPGVEEAIRGAAHVLKPTGKLIFFEIAVSADARVRRWQERWEPIHLRLFEGLYLTRDIAGLLRQGGFEIGSVPVPTSTIRTILVHRLRSSDRGGLALTARSPRSG
jgi:hypothetical protein